MTPAEYRAAASPAEALKGEGDRARIRHGSAPASRPVAEWSGTRQTEQVVSMYHREYPITPSQRAINGALSIYVEGGQKEDVRQILFGLSVLRHATEEQIRIAMPFVQTSRGITSAGIQEVLAR